MKILFYFGLGVILFFFPEVAIVEGGWLIYREGPFKGRVVDAQSKEPIEGAVVVAQYHVMRLTVVGYRMELLDVQEAVTDDKGEFYIPVYTTMINPLSIGEDVSFLIWKPGYKKEDKWGGYFFAKEPGTIEDRPVQTDRGYEVKAVRLGIIELSKLISKVERRKNIPSLPSWDEFLDKQANLIRLINEEEEFLGLQKSDPFKAPHSKTKGK